MQHARSVWLFAGTITIALLAGCGKEPHATDVQDFLKSQLAATSYLSVQSVQVETTKATADKISVQFKAQVRLEQPLFRVVDAEQLMKSGGWDPTMMTKAVDQLQALPSEESRRIVADSTATTAAPTVVEQTSAAGATKEWYGTLDAQYVVDKWSFTNLVSIERGEFAGESRDKFGAKTYLVGAADTAEALESTRKARMALIELIAAKAQLAMVRRDREVAEAKAAELKLAQDQVAADKRKLPIQLSMRAANFDSGRGVLVIRSAVVQPMSLDVAITDGKLIKRMSFTISPDRPQEIGWLQGWSFKTGDRVLIQNPSYDPWQIRIP